MLRLAGILTGSALAIAVLIATLGIPQLGATTEQQVTIAPTMRDDLGSQKIVAEAGESAADLNAEPQSEPRALPAPIPVPTTQTDAVSTGRQQSVPAEAEQIDVVPEPQVTAADPAPGTAVENPEAVSWFAFWSPFRSEIAANGFVSELQRSTGLDYRVVKVKPGVYEVAFAYASDTDRQNKLERISAATGLDVSGG